MNAKDQMENWERLKFDLGAQILSYLEDDDVIEIMVNPDSSIWIEKHNQDMKEVGKLTPEKTMMIINTVAYSLNAIVDQKNPDISAEFPIDGSRFQATIPPIADAPSFSIRKKAIKIYSLADYVSLKTITEKQRDLISKICSEKKNILIVGATGTGKTTFANALLKEISVLDPNCRIGIIEDTRELQCDIKNKHSLKTSENRNIQDLLKIMLRLRPNRICIGEVRGAEANDLITAWNTGHSGGIATVHANNGRAGIRRIEQILKANRMNPVPEIIAEAINVIVSIQRSGFGRKVEEILEVSCENNEYIFKEIY